MNTTAEFFFQNASLPFNLIIIGVKKISEDSLEIYEIFRVSEDFPYHMDVVGNWSTGEGLYINPRTMFGRRYDFQGKVLRAGSVEKWPFSTFNGYLNKDQPWGGLYCTVWNELGRLLNFRTVIYRDDFIGLPQPNGSWNGLIEKVLNDKIDVIVADVRMTKTRLEVLQYTYPLISSWDQIYFRPTGYRLRWSAVFQPFRFDVWMAILSWIGAGSFCFYISFQVYLTYGLEHKLGKNFTFVDSLFLMIRSLTSQDYNLVPKTIVCRTIFLMAYIAGAVLIPAYSASLISSLTQHSPVRPFDSLEELLEDGTYKLIVEGNTSEYAYFQTARDSTLRMIYHKLLQPIPIMHYGNFSSYGLELVCRHEKLALYDSQVIMKMKNTVALNCELLRLTQSLTKVDKGIAFAKGDPYAIYIHHHIHRMTEAGLIRRIQRQLSPHKTKVFAPWNPVEVKEVFQMFSFLAFCILISILVLIAEIVHSNFNIKVTERATELNFRDNVLRTRYVHSVFVL